MGVVGVSVVAMSIVVVVSVVIGLVGKSVVVGLVGVVMGTVVGTNTNSATEIYDCILEPTTRHGNTDHTWTSNLP